jgi:hypothetical protein
LEISFKIYKMNSFLFTGSSGFLGTNLKPWLQEKYLVKTMGLGTNDDYNINIAETIPEITEKFDVILHAAGKAHAVPKTEAEEKSFFRYKLPRHHQSVQGIGTKRLSQRVYFYQYRSGLRLGSW